MLMMLVFGTMDDVKMLQLMLMMLGLLCWEWPLVSLKGLLMLMMLAV